jgi:protein-tyrosine-phosphatase
MPVHVCASLLAGVVASLGLGVLFGAPPPSVAQVVAATIVILAALMLSYPAVRARLTRAGVPAQRSRKPLLLFVCGGNAVRSPMAAAIAEAELAALGNSADWRVESAGVAVEQPGAGIAPLAARALRELDVPVPRHESRPVTAALCLESDVVFCMTAAHREGILALAPELRGRVHCLDVDDVVEPAEADYRSHVDCARQLRALVRLRVGEVRVQRGPAVASGG